MRLLTDAPLWPILPGPPLARPAPRECHHCDRAFRECVEDLEMDDISPDVETRDMTAPAQAPPVARLIPRTSYADYAAIDAVNWSTLKVMARSPRHYRHALANPRPPSPAMLLGTAAHLATLEADRWDDEVRIFDGAARRGKAWEAFQAANPGRLLLNQAEADKAQAMAAAVRDHGPAAEYLSAGEPEVGVVWTDDTTGLSCKARVDWLHVLRDSAGRIGRVILVDLKTAREIGLREFSAQAARLGYFGQLAHYRAGIAAALGIAPEMIEVVLVAVENDAPHDVAVFAVDDGVPDGGLHYGETERRRLLKRLVECRDADEWPGQHPEVTPLCPPAWASAGVDVEDFQFADDTGEGE